MSMRTVSCVFRLTSFAALGLAVAVAYGTSTATAAPPSAAAGPPSGLKGVPGERSPHAAFSDCSVGHVLGMAHAFNQAATLRAKVAAGRAQDPSVKQFAERSLDDHQKLEQELSRWESDVGAQPVETDISRALLRNARVELKGLEDAQNFDREYVADEIVASIKAAGFLHILVHAIHEGGAGDEQGQPTGGAPVPQPAEMGQPTQPGPISFPQPGQVSIPQPEGIQLPQPGTPGAPGATEGQSESKLGEVTKLFEDAKHAIGSELKDALRLEGQLVGTCGESPGQTPATKKAPPLH
jgi:predicted outer membrane protein